MTWREEIIGDARLILADCREVLPALSGVDAVVTDPPYGEAMGFDGDDDPRKAATLAGSTFCLLNAATRPGAYAACFWTMRSLDLLLDEVRAVGWSYLRALSMYGAGTARPHLAWVPRLQPIVLFRNGTAIDLHDRLSVWLKAKIDSSGMTLADISRALGCDSRLVMKWSRHHDPSWCLPTPRFWVQLKELLQLTDEFDVELSLSREPTDRRHDWDYRHDLYSVSGGRKSSDHPAEKPIGVLTHITASLARSNEVVLDPFMGSGTTGVACARQGRRFIGVEIEPRYFDMACRRIDAAHRQYDLFVPQSDHGVCHERR